MKKFIVLLAVLVPFVALAQAAPAPSVASFDLKAFLQQIGVNGGFVLLSFLLSKIPGVGVYLKKVIDVLIGNPEHKA